MLEDHAMSWSDAGRVERWMDSGCGCSLSALIWAAGGGMLAGCSGAVCSDGGDDDVNILSQAISASTNSEGEGGGGEDAGGCDEHGPAEGEGDSRGRVSGMAVAERAAERKLSRGKMMCFKSLEIVEEYVMRFQGKKSVCWT
jgi:hypothetical protein